VYWYNVKYQRVGHLFQDQFKREPVENDSYLLTVIRYLHQNPVKVGICKKEKGIIKLKNNGLSIRQISRLTGISKGMVEKWIK